MKVIIMHGNISKYDAIGNDIVMMYDLLKVEHDCYVYTKNPNREGLQYLTAEDTAMYLKDESCLLIYHHSIYWEEGEYLLNMCKGHIIICYHNITSPEFFQNYEQAFVENCSKGREQTKQFIKQYPKALWLVDSEFNATDLDEVPKNKLLIRPPFHRVDLWKNIQADDRISNQLRQDSDLKLLSVGRIVPNKKYEFLIEVVRCYCENYNSKIKLYLIGKSHSGLRNYDAMLSRRIKSYGLENHIVFIGETKEEELLAYYKGCDIYVCASEHEGFCVPLLESQKLELPVVARNFGAVSETLGKEAFEIICVREFTAAIHLTADDLRIRKRLIRFGKNNYDKRYRSDILKYQFQEIISCVTNEED